MLCSLIEIGLLTLSIYLYFVLSKSNTYISLKLIYNLRPTMFLIEMILLQIFSEFFSFIYVTLKLELYSITLSIFCYILHNLLRTTYTLIISKLLFNYKQNKWANLLFITTKNLNISHIFFKLNILRKWNVNSQMIIFQKLINTCQKIFYYT